HAQSGENPELRTLMYKLVTLANAPVHAHFIFDGEDRPPIKRGKHVRSAPHWLTRSLQELLQIFGFTWTMAKGEAEADLAFLSKAGKISAVLTEDSDALLFGAAKVLCLTDNDDGTFLVDAYCAEALSNNPKIPLTTSHLLLWAMLHGGDYNPGGLLGCGSQVSHALLAGDLSDSLMRVMTSVAPAQLPGMLKTWRDHLCTVLVDGTLGRKYPALAASIPADFPSVEIMHLYLHPVTTWSDGTNSSLLPQLNPTQPNIGRLAAFCKACLGWMRPKIHKYLRHHFWSAACMRALCQVGLLYLTVVSANS
ncbi:PIN domain-like protein, partial [Suillus fuscotomentosus]